MSPYSLGISLYNWFDTFAHDSFRKKFARIYSTSQLNAAKCNYPNWKTLTKEQKKADAIAFMNKVAEELFSQLTPEEQILVTEFLIHSKDRCNNKSTCT